MFVLSSLHEGLPGVLIQALACGVPVVSTDCPSGPREILEGGTYGRLVALGDHAAMAEAILDTLDQPGDAEARIARGRQFNVERSVDRYLGLLSATGLRVPSPPASDRAASRAGRPMSVAAESVTQAAGGLAYSDHQDWNINSVHNSWPWSRHLAWC